MSIQNAVKSGTGLAIGATRTFTCDGNYAWSDDTTGGKPVYCQPDGTWTGIPLTCLRMIEDCFKIANCYEIYNGWNLLKD